MESGRSGGFNRYAYVQNSPLSWTDPSGFETKDGVRPYDAFLENLWKSILQTLQTEPRDAQGNFTDPRVAIALGPYLTPQRTILNPYPAVATEAVQAPAPDPIALVRGIAAGLGQELIQAGWTGGGFSGSAPQLFAPPDTPSGWLGYDLSPALAMLLPVRSVSVAKGASEATTLYRAVGARELADIQTIGRYRVAAGGTEGEYFFKTPQQASNFARMMGDQPYTTTSIRVSPTELSRGQAINPAREGPGYFFSTSDLPKRQVDIWNLSVLP
jgi:hypothetical protein